MQPERVAEGVALRGPCSTTERGGYTESSAEQGMLYASD